MKVALCCIGRQENRYIREFVEYYKNLGVDKIFLYDNNYDDEEHFEDVINDYIENGFVEITDFRNKSICQLEAYQDCYDRRSKEYDWICFFDIDEFLEFSDSNDIKTFLSDEKFTSFDMIHVNELIYGDSNLVKYENKKVVERFIKPVQPIDFKKTYDFPENCHIKSIVRGNLTSIKWIATPHTPIGVNSCCSTNGEVVNSNSPFVIPFTLDNAKLKHYNTKTIDEFLTNKVKRGYPDGNKDFFKKNNWILDFFKENEITEEKIKFINEYENRKYSKKISVIVPCFNQNKYIKETLNSLKASTYNDWECVIVNDGSTDNSEDIIFSCIENDNRFKYIKQKNKGVGSARNLGISKSNGRYILCLDSDDKISNTYIERGIEYLDSNPICSIYYGNAKMFYDDGSQNTWNLPLFNYKTLL